MKRSKMVLFIAEMMVDPRYEESMSQASLMLRKLEERGMKPPLLYPGTQTEPEDIYRWEPETFNTDDLHPEDMHDPRIFAESVPMQTIDPKTFGESYVCEPGLGLLKCTCKGSYQPASCPIHGDK